MTHRIGTLLAAAAIAFALSFGPARANYVPPTAPIKASVAIPINLRLAQIGPLGVGPLPFNVSHYVGPGDIVSGATAFWGLRAYNAAYATGSNSAITVRRASDNATQNIVILTSGALDIATANTFAGTDATCQGSTTGSSTTIAFTGCSATPKANDTVSGTGITQPSYLAACGAFVAGAGSCTLNVAQNIAVAETVTMQVALFITTWFDQSGASACSGACNLTQSTAGDQPQLLPVCLSGLPCLNFNGTSDYLTVGSCVLTALPATASMVRNRTGNLSSIANDFVLCGNSTHDTAFYSTATANQMAVFANANLTATVSDNAWHAVLASIPAAGNTSIYVDNSATTGSAGNTMFTGTGQATQLGAAVPTPASFFAGRMTEAIEYATAQGATNAGLICHNQYTYWGTATPC